MLFTSLIVLYVLLNVDCQRYRTPEQLRIIGGEIVSIASFPFVGVVVLKPLGSIKDEDIYFAGGTSITAPKWAVTAAHCVIDFQREIKYGRVFIRSNSTIWSNETSLEMSEHLVLNVIIHKQFDGIKDDYDIALLKVKQEFVGKYERPIPLAEVNYKFKAGTLATILGWGTTTLGAEPFTVLELRATEVNLIDPKVCIDKFRNTSEVITTRMLCAGAHGRDACVNDSGGPLVQNHTLIGIVSWGLECASDAHPGVYTKVMVFTSWIRRIQEKY
ncbi:hypothetical protein ILUMI_11330 [Ignelater luminosus]|uniref:Peptidase S1 domain-containing protein n=1 Tax=Ignelater luminosus TaxID=2038154 RepID=A0A8K0D1M3_IGNLU|nr:hypothetical protein ILUMI_11330 [Ignelater luminosus]